jgi:hypothetical protein
MRGRISPAAECWTGGTGGTGRADLACGYGLNELGCDGAAEPGDAVGQVLWRDDLDQVLRHHR